MFGNNEMSSYSVTRFPVNCLHVCFQKNNLLCSLNAISTYVNLLCTFLKYSNKFEKEIRMNRNVKQAILDSKWHVYRNKSGIKNKNGNANLENLVCNILWFFKAVIKVISEYTIKNRWSVFLLDNSESSKQWPTHIFI